MNKILLFFNILLLIALGISIYFCVQFLNKNLAEAETSYLKTKALTDAGLTFEIKDDNTYVVVERTVPLRSEE